ncbi:chromosomal replication initiator protein DnaA [Jannaschia sp. CCS1]|uniref:Chromosomal replication initiator protein DnaA n=1 Tax=Jannaschia sp. (strain CCS1) TaxID=290400 RepID=DNAA_JANSC|nr:chromosomal replication initiator protein DnaA [Jannaschia sp. CCS1]Q28WI0.1 RecName: Full=Chromosomal replication initiator protein DnaA [Jannaschia sp. CCS1]ABD52918.1 chromosomal replication initiator protein DnaA [Jannaschia sp. CCS1]
MTNDTWNEVRQDLLKVVGKNNFSAWIEPIDFDRIDERTAHFHVPTNFIGSWVTNNFGDLILRQLSAHGAGADRVKFTVSPKAGAAVAAPANTSAPRPVPEMAAAAPAPAPVHHTAPAPAPVAAPAQPRELPGAKLNPNFTFANFVVGKPNELAHAAARRVAETLDVTFNPLFLYGGVGLGKTHLMHAIAWDLQDRHPDAKILFLSAEQFMHRFVRALREQDTFNFKETFRSVDILMVDDVQFIAGKTSTQQEFFHTFNALVEMGKQIVISGDRAPVDMEELDNRIASRLQCGLVVDIHPTDYELRLGVLQHKAELLGAKYPHITFATGVLEYLAQKISSNVRVLEGALTRLFAFADLVRREVTVDLAKECLTDVLRATDKKVTMDEILKKTCEYYKIRQVDMISQNRQRVIARPRQMAMYLCKRLTTRSLPEIGKKFGGRDHTTILYGVRKIEELMQADSQIAEDAELLRRTLEA